MLSPHDAQLAARDATLIGLPLLLDPAALLELLQTRLSHIRFNQIRPTYLRYKPQTNCLAAYQLQTSLGEVDLHAKAYIAEDVAKLRKSEYPDSASILGPGEFLFEDAGIRIVIFPNDAHLPSLRLFATPADVDRLLERVLPRTDFTSSHTIRRLAYKPERRFVAQLLLDQQPHAVLRFYTADDFARANRNAKVLQPSGALRLPQRLGRSSRYSVSAVAWMEGTLLSERLPHDAFPTQLFAVGQALAALHSAEPYKLHTKSRKDEVDALSEAADFTSAICPDLHEPLQRLKNQLSQYLLELPTPRQAIHGDFYAAQILFQADGVAFLDLDEVSRGDPSFDLGNFLAHLIRQGISSSRIRPLRESFLKGYTAAGGIIDTDRIDHYTAASLLRLTPEPFRQRQSDWPDATAGFVREAQSLVPQRRTCASPPTSACAVDDPYGVANDPKMPFLADAIDPLRFQRLLNESFPGSAVIQGLRVIRYKPQRRCLIEYDLKIDRQSITVIGKARARGLDQDTFNLQRTLWEGAFGEHSPDGISVPQPLATIPPLQMWLQRRLCGIPATDALPHPDQPNLPQRLADAIFKLHRCGIQPRRSHTITDELRILHERLPTVADHHSHLRDRIQCLLDQCDRLGRQLPPMPTSPIHRDLHPDQILLAGDRLYILDLDLFCEGDPALDLGNLVAHLSEHALRKLGRADALAAQESSIIDRYQHLASIDLRNRIAAYAALSLVRLVHISTLFQDRIPFTERILALGEARIRELSRCGLD